VVARPTRRSFLRRAGAALIAVEAVRVAGCGGDDEDAGRDSTATGLGSDTPGDAGVLNGALAQEYAAIAAYTAGAPLLSGRALAAARRFLAQERAHAARLRSLVRGLGAVPAQPEGAYDFGAPARASDVLRLLRRVEQRSIYVCVDAVGRLEDPRLRAIVAAIVAVEAQHESVLLAQIGRWPVPTAFVAGMP
jgi:rubrerythrin